jgi:non-canonical purine NTP pyrophosphatase (RdgB/HAM1 family)
MRMTLYKYSDLTFVSGNRDKYIEYKALLGIADLRWSERRLHESQNVSVAALVEEKIRTLETQMGGTPFFVEHTGLVIEAWRNLPGGLTRVFLDNVGNDGLCRMMRDYTGEDRVAAAIVVIGFRSPDGRVRTFTGESRGQIANEPVGSNNFGWDPIFVPKDQPGGTTKTYAEMSLDEKNRCSMRRSAVVGFLDYIKDIFVL